MAAALAADEAGSSSSSQEPPRDRQLRGKTAAPGPALVHRPGGEHAAHRCRAGLREEVAARVHVRRQHIAAAAEQEQLQFVIDTALVQCLSVMVHARLDAIDCDSKSPTLLLAGSLRAAVQEKVW